MSVGLLTMLCLAIDCNRERSQLRKDLIPWAVTAGLRSKNFMNVFYEQRFEELLEDLQRQMNLSPAPTTV